VYRFAVPWVRIPPPPLPSPLEDVIYDESRVPDAALAISGPGAGPPVGTTSLSLAPANWRTRETGLPVRGLVGARLAVRCRCFRRNLAVDPISCNPFLIDYYSPANHLGEQGKPDPQFFRHSLAAERLGSADVTGFETHCDFGFMETHRAVDMKQNAMLI
jgi:hypothetical protein